MAQAKNIGSGWHSQSIRHSNARKYGKAGGTYLVAVRIPNLNTGSNKATIFEFKTKGGRDDFIKDLKNKFPFKYATSMKEARKFGSARDLVNQFAQGATRGKASNMFIDGNAIYSYGYHFPMAYRTKSGKFLLNKNKYSTSTSKQQSRVRNALSGYTEVSLDTLQKAISEQI